MAGQKKGCCVLLHLREDNARFVLLFLLLVTYLLLGALLFMTLEGENEATERAGYRLLLDDFLANNPDVNVTELNALLTSHAEMAASGLLTDKRPRWDFEGAFYFVGTVVTTIGFGMTTPRTAAGKAAVIAYGLFGCSGTILFLNLFLERIITLIAHVLKLLHERNTRRRRLQAAVAPTAALRGRRTRRRRRSSSDASLRRPGEEEDEEGDAGAEWKPSVYWVMLILLLAAAAFACSASAVYRKQEDWTYLEALYFCFVAFSTVGFGDYVINQRPEYGGGDVIYAVGNFFVVLIGCCVVYSLFNVTSIVIKQPLNVIIRKLNCRCPPPPPPPPPCRRGNAVAPVVVGRARREGAPPPQGEGVSNHGGSGSSDGGCSRRGSSEISMRDFLRVSKITMAMMQKQLYDAAHRGAERAQESGGFQGGVGPLAILNHTLYPEEI